MNDERTHKRKRADNAQAGAYVHTPQATKRKGGRNAPDIRSIYGELRKLSRGFLGKALLLHNYSLC